MKFKQLIDEVNFDEVKTSLLSSYEREEYNISGYERVFSQLKEMSPEQNNMRIIITSELEKNEVYYGVSGKDGTLNKDTEEFQYFDESVQKQIGENEIHYALDLCSWEEWLGMDIDIDTLRDYTKEEIVAHCLYEMTFCGFTQDAVTDLKDEINRRIEEIDSGKAKLYSMEEVKERLKDILD